MQNKIFQDLKHIISLEDRRQEEQIELIASENYASKNIMQIQGSTLTNKYAEGYPKNRYYAGCEHIDKIEILAIELAKKLFGAKYANVQPHSGYQENISVYLALLHPGDVILGMGLSDGGHLSHGSKVNISGKLFKCIAYGIDPKTEDINYEEVERLALLHKPKIIIAGFSAFSLIINWERFRRIADKINAYLLADIAHVAGLIVAGYYPSPIDIADIVTSTTHKTLRGPRGGIILSKRDGLLEKKIQSALFPGVQGGPLMHVIAAKAAAFIEALEPNFKTYQSQVIKNAKAMGKVFIEEKINVVGKKTENHMIVIDLRKEGKSGLEVEKTLSSVNIIVNKNTIPNDPRSPKFTSGLRIGTAAISTRGFKEKESRIIAKWISAIIREPENLKLQKLIKDKVSKLCKSFPVYG